MNNGQKSALAYQALLDLSDELDKQGKPAAAESFIECIDEMSEETLALFYDIMSAAIEKVRA